MSEKTEHEQILIARAEAASHAIQTGVQMEMELDPDSSATKPKHLRVGVNVSLVGIEAIAKLLIAKRIITRLDFQTMMTLELEREKERYEDVLSKKLNRKVTLA